MIIITFLRITYLTLLIFLSNINNIFWESNKGLSIAGRLLIFKKMLSIFWLTSRTFHFYFPRRYLMICKCASATNTFLLIYSKFFFITVVRYENFIMKLSHYWLQFKIVILISLEVSFFQG